MPRTPHPAPTDPFLYTPEEAAKILKVRASWLRRRAAARLIPCTFLGKHLRFSAGDIAAIIASGSRPMGGSRSRRRTVPKPSGRDLPPQADRSVHASRDDPDPDGSNPWHG